MRISDWSSDVCSSDLYSFYTAWHLPVLEFGISIARVALCRDAVTGSLRPPSVDVVAPAKRPLRQGETTDGIGGYLTYRVGPKHPREPPHNLLPSCPSQRPSPRQSMHCVASGDSSAMQRARGG